MTPQYTSITYLHIIFCIQVLSLFYCRIDIEVWGVGHPDSQKQGTCTLLCYSAKAYVERVIALSVLFAAALTLKSKGIKLLERFNFYVVCISSGDILICRIFEFWSTNNGFLFVVSDIGTFLLVKQKKVDQQNALFLSFKLVLRSWKLQILCHFLTSKFGRTANHRMKYIQHKPPNHR